MCIRYLGFILLIWFPRALHAQSAAQSCSAPRLDGGFFAPKQQTYSDGTELSYTCDEGHKPAVKGWWATSTCHNGKWSPEPQCIGRETRPTTGQGGGTQPAGGGSSTTSGSTDRDSGPTFRPVDDCGAYPYIPNSDVVQKGRMFLKYQCKAFHTLVGEATVACYSDRTWSPLPVCKETFCVLDPAQNPLPNVQLSRVEYLKEGERKHFPCIWYDYSRRVQCTNGRITTTGCCSTYDHGRGICP
ncbi:complement factor H-like isoform X2 [Epinephelus lanceolatus]